MATLYGHTVLYYNDINTFFGYKNNMTEQTFMETLPGARALAMAIKRIVQIIQYMLEHTQ